MTAAATTGPGQRTAAGLVDAGDRAAVQLQLRRLQLEGRSRSKLGGSIPHEGEGSTRLLPEVKAARARC